MCVSEMFVYWSCEQQPLRLNPVEVCEVIAAVCSETPSPNANLMTISSKLSTNSGKPSMDVAVSVLIKLLAERPGSPESLQQLVEVARNPAANYATNAAAFSAVSMGKEDNIRQAREKKVNHNS
ncbi:hypothetical protein U1Q18_005400 [Sarracenia purpurea var. burkii]